MDKDKVAQIRTAVADYMGSEGCSCCRNIAAHDLNTKRLAELLGVPDSSADPQYPYYDFRPFRSEQSL